MFERIRILTEHMNWFGSRNSRRRSIIICWMIDVVLVVTFSTEGPFRHQSLVWQFNMMVFQQIFFNVFCNKATLENRLAYISKELKGHKRSRRYIFFLLETTYSLLIRPPSDWVVPLWELLLVCFLIQFCYACQMNVIVWGK